MTELQIAVKAVQIYAETHPRPSHVSQKQAANMLNRTKQTISKMVSDGRIKLNDCGMIPITEIDRVLQARQ